MLGAMSRRILFPFFALLAGCPADCGPDGGFRPRNFDAGFDGGVDAASIDAGTFDAAPFDAGPTVEPEARCRLSPTGTLSELTLAKVEVMLLDPECPSGTIDYSFHENGIEVLRVHLTANRPGGTGAIAVTGCSVVTVNGNGVPTSEASCTFSGTVDGGSSTVQATIDGSIVIAGTCPIDASVDATTTAWIVCL